MQNLSLSKVKATQLTTHHHNFLAISFSPWENSLGFEEGDVIFCNSISQMNYFLKMENLWKWYQMSSGTVGVSYGFTTTAPPPTSPAVIALHRTPIVITIPYNPNFLWQNSPNLNSQTSLPPRHKTFFMPNHMYIENRMWATKTETFSAAQRKKPKLL